MRVLCWNSSYIDQIPTSDLSPVLFKTAQATVVLGRSMASFRERSEDGPRTVSDPPFHQVVQSPEYLGGCEPCTRPAPCDRGIYGGATSAHGAQLLRPVSGYPSPARTR